MPTLLHTPSPLLPCRLEPRLRTFFLFFLFFLFFYFFIWIMNYSKNSSSSCRLGIFYFFFEAVISVFACFSYIYFLLKPCYFLVFLFYVLIFALGYSFFAYPLSQITGFIIKYDRSLTFWV